MRIITGKLKGRTIPVPDTDLLRPTSDRAKEGIFSLLEARTYLAETHVLDLFAGSGNLGFEAISRGAQSCVFVDREERHTRHIQKLSEAFGVSPQVRTVTSDTETYLQNRSGRFDVIFADPPYDYFYMEEMVDVIFSGGWLADEGWLILEHDKRHDFSSRKNALLTRAYGRTTVSIFRPENVS